MVALLHNYSSTQLSIDIIIASLLVSTLLSRFFTNLYLKIYLDSSHSVSSFVSSPSHPIPYFSPSTLSQLPISLSFSTGNIVISDNYIETTISDSNLDLRANGTGIINIPSNNLKVDQDFIIAGTSNLQDTTIIGNVTHTGTTTQTGNIALTGNFGVTGNVTVSGVSQFEDIKIETNVITTTISNSDLELRATEYGDISIPTNDVVINNDLNVTGTINVGNVTSLGTITANRFSTGDILIDDNFITTTLSDSDLELRANGAGEVIVPSNNVVIEQNLAVDGQTNLKNTTVTGDITHTGNVTQTGDINLSGNLDVTGEVIISASVIQFEQIQLSELE